MNIFQSRGGGFEVEIHYPQWRRVSKPIERFTVLLDSLTRLIEGKIFILIKENYAILVNYHCIDFFVCVCYYERMRSMLLSFTTVVNLTILS